MWKRWGTPQNFLLAFSDELWKPEKLKFWKKENKNKKKTKLLEISPFYTCVPKATIIWSTVPEIGVRQNFFVILGNFMSFYPPPPTPYQPRKPKFWKNEKSIWRCHHFKLVQQKTWSYDVCLLRYGVWQTWWSYDIWFLRYGAWQIEFFIISSYFLPFYPPNNTKNQNFEKMIKTPGGIIILNVSAMKENHMINDSWDMEQNFLPFYTPFPTLTTQRIKILKKRKKRLEYHHLIQVYQKSWSNALLFLRYGMQQM